MLYTIEWMEHKTTSTGKNKIDATLKDAAGVMTENVTIWDSFTNFPNLMPGQQVEGDITVKQNGQYTNKTLNAPRVTTAPRVGAFKQMQIEKTMDKKNESIAHFQNEKEMSIRIASTFRAASEMAVAEYQESHRLSPSAPSLEALFEKWREWLWMRYEVKINDYPPNL